MHGWLICTQSTKLKHTPALATGSLVATEALIHTRSLPVYEIASLSKFWSLPKLNTYIHGRYRYMKTSPSFSRTCTVATGNSTNDRKIATPISHVTARRSAHFSRQSSLHGLSYLLQPQPRIRHPPLGRYQVALLASAAAAHKASPTWPLPSRFACISRSRA